MSDRQIVIKITCLNRLRNSYYSYYSYYGVPLLAKITSKVGHISLLLLACGDQIGNILPSATTTTTKNNNIIINNNKNKNISIINNKKNIININNKTS
jgi:hypothetical protein